MSGNPPVPMAPGSNVTPMWGPGGWPGRPPPSPPSCFSQLYGLNQCYDDIIAMQQILQKVICDMATNNAEFAQCLAAGIAKVGAGGPITGVTDGSSAAPGIVGEFIQLSATGSYTAAPQTQIITAGVLQPGDWDVQAFCNFESPTGGAEFYESTGLVGLSSNMSGFLGDNSGSLTGIQMIGVPARWLSSVPGLFGFTILTNTTNSGSAVAGNFAFFMVARRAR